MRHARHLTRGLAHFANNLVSPAERSAIWQLRIENQVSFVLLGDKSNGYNLKTNVGKHHQAGVHNERDGTNTKQPGNQPTVDIDRDVEEPIEPAEKSAKDMIHNDADKPAHDGSPCEHA